MSSPQDASSRSAQQALSKFQELESQVRNLSRHTRLVYRAVARMCRLEYRTEAQARERPHLAYIDVRGCLRPCELQAAAAQWQAFGQRVTARGGDQGVAVRRSAGLLEAARQRFAGSPEVRPGLNWAAEAEATPVACLDTVSAAWTQRVQLCRMVSHKVTSCIPSRVRRAATPALGTACSHRSVLHTVQ